MSAHNVYFAAGVRRRQVARTVLRVGAAVLLAGHGAIHLMGALLLWRVSETGTLRYADATPAAGSAGGLVVGSLWLVCALIFVAAAWLCVSGHRVALSLATGAAVLSAGLLTMMMSAAPAGLAVDVAILAFAGAVHLSRRVR